MAVCTFESNRNENETDLNQKKDNQFYRQLSSNGTFIIRGQSQRVNCGLRKIRATEKWQMVRICDH